MTPLHTRPRQTFVAGPSFGRGTMVLPARLTTRWLCQETAPLPPRDEPSLVNAALDGDPGARQALLEWADPLLDDVLVVFGTSLRTHQLPEPDASVVQQRARCRHLLLHHILKGYKPELSLRDYVRERLTTLLTLKAAEMGARSEMETVFSRLNNLVNILVRKRLTSLRAHGVPISDVDHEDAVQNIWTVLLSRGLWDYGGESSLESFVASIVFRRVGDFATRARTRWDANLRVVDGEGQLLLNRVEDVNVMAPDEGVRLSHLHARISEALTPRQTEVWTLHFEKGLSHEAIAESLGMKASAVAVTLSQARERLRLAMPDLKQAYYVPESSRTGVKRDGLPPEGGEP